MPNTANTTVYETAADLANVHSVLQALETFAVANGWTAMKSCLAEDIADTVITPDDSSQAGWIGAATSPWVSNHEDMATITDSVIEFTVDKGNDYYVQLEGFTEGDFVEVEYEIIDRTLGTMQLWFGDTTNRYNSTDRRVHKFVATMGAGGFLRFDSDDFIGTFQLLSIRTRTPTIELSLFRSSVGYFHFKSEISSVQDKIAHKGPFIYLCTSSGWEEGAEYDAHPGTSPISCTNNIDDYYYNNIFGYHFFGTDKHIYVVVEPWEGEFCHFGFGSIYKYWDFRGGNFVYGCRWKMDGLANLNETGLNGHSYPLGYYHYDNSYSNWMRADLLGSTLNTYLQASYYADSSNKWKYLYGDYHGFTDTYYDENAYYGTAPLSPVHLAGQDINAYRYPLGEMEEYRRTFCKYLDPKTVLSINQEDWMVFPVRRKQLVTPEEWVSNSSNYALAFYKGPTPV